MFAYGCFSAPKSRTGELHKGFPIPLQSQKMKQAQRFWNALESEKVLHETRNERCTRGNIVRYKGERDDGYNLLDIFLVKFRCVLNKAKFTGEEKHCFFDHF